MKKLWGALIGAGLLTAMTMGPASANVVFSVSGITASSGGNLLGTFTTDNAFATLLAADITTPATGGYTSFDYTFGISGANSVNNSNLASRFLRLDAGGGFEELQFSFVSTLNASGATLVNNGTSYNDLVLVQAPVQLLGGTITPAVAAVPEPVSLSLFGAGLAGAAALGMRRRKRAKA